MSWTTGKILPAPCCTLCSYSCSLIARLPPVATAVLKRCSRRASWRRSSSVGKMVCYQPRRSATHGRMKLVESLLELACHVKVKFHSIVPSSLARERNHKKHLSHIRKSVTHVLHIWRSPKQAINRGLRWRPWTRLLVLRLGLGRNPGSAQKTN